jgi:membrane-bound lytic murein transglycosylase B
MRKHAISEGISQKTVDQALSNIAPVQKVIDLDRNQPSAKWTFNKYRQKIVHPIRIKKGQEMYRKHKTLLDDISSRYGVAPQYIVALWGIETNYGQNTGGFDIVPALATLAWEGRRGEFFKKELVNALRIVDQGHVALGNFKGSWAGALGQNQFMPSSFHNFAADGDGDGRKDIWNNLSDVFASTANYLAKNGWQDGERWGRAVIVPAGFDHSNEGLKVKKSLDEWKRLGLKTSDGSAIPVVPGMSASVVMPDGKGTQAFLIYDNYRTIMKWNRSTYFATSVGLLADQISQAKVQPQQTPS